jgi:hypothetical protein
MNNAAVTDVEKIERFICNFESERESLQGRIVVLSKQRLEIAYAARSGDKASKARLSAIATEISDVTGEVEIVTAAIAEAQLRLQAAQQAEAAAADRINAQKARELQVAFVERLEALDEACVDVGELTTEVKILLSEMRKHGITAPSDAVFRINCIAGLKTMLMTTPWNPVEFSSGPQFLAPGERRSFKKLAEAWNETLTHQLAGRLATEKTEAA